MKRVIICLLCLMLICGCSSTKSTVNTSKITIVTTIFPLYDFARAIGGEHIEVEMLIRPGTEVHSYDPLPSDMAKIYESDLFLYIGGESETWVYNLIDDSEINSLALINKVVYEHQDHHQHTNGHNHADEHIWTSPKNAVVMLESICEKLCLIDPENANVYKKNCNAYISKINSVSEEIATVVSKSESPFILVADRFPFSFLAQEYGIDYEAAFDGCAVTTDISMKTMSRLTKTVQKKGIKSVYCTELSNKSIANALSEELNVEVIELHSAHNVTLDEFEQGITYVDILYRNANALERGLS